MIDKNKNENKNTTLESIAEQWVGFVLAQIETKKQQKAKTSNNEDQKDYE